MLRSANPDRADATPARPPCGRRESEGKQRYWYRRGAPLIATPVDRRFDFSCCDRSPAQFDRLRDLDARRFIRREPAPKQLSDSVLQFLALVNCSNFHFTHQFT